MEGRRWWRTPGFGRLTVSWVLANLADSALLLVLAIWVKELTGNDGAAALTFALLGAATLFSPLLAGLADRWPRRSVLGWSNLVAGVVVATLLLVDGPGWVGWIYVVTVVYAGAAQLGAAAQSGLVRDLLPDALLARGNGLLAGIDQGARLVVPLVATGAYVVLGPHVVAVVAAAGFVLAGALLLRGRPPTSGVRPVSGERWLVQAVAGFRHLRSVPALRTLTLTLAVGLGATGTVQVAIFPFVEQGLDSPPGTLGVLVAANGVGAACGALTAGRVTSRLGEARVCRLGLVVMATGIALLLVEHLVTGLVGLALAGWAVTWMMVAFVTLRQRLTPGHLQGRVAAATMLVVNVPQTVMVALTAAVVTALDHRVLVAFAAVAVALTATVGVGTRRRGA
ncbi:MFS transporter [Phycicoccus flavus]|uniref:MFS transporter n=1 Tax=Phycicoccus flavus TaxID=2502783 RepID=A0A8T6R0K0_9MICO|nr:MFS transporter [Phycicoccus flavus]NHA66990.1 MFS transporter [Phycicoccus flavus]